MYHSNILYKSNKNVCIELYQEWLYIKIVKNEVFLKMNYHESWYDWVRYFLQVPAVIVNLYTLYEVIYFGNRISHTIVLS